jgi:hypothetical protein
LAIHINRRTHRAKAFEKRVLRNMSKPKKQELTEDSAQLYNKELHDWYSSPNIRVEMGRACSRFGGEEMCTGFWRKNLNVRDHFEDLGMDWRIL